MLQILCLSCVYQLISSLLCIYEVNLNQLHSDLKFGGKTRFQIWQEISNSKNLKLIFRDGPVNRTCNYIFRDGLIKPTTPKMCF
jgi:hypothetical protein